MKRTDPPAAAKLPLAQQQADFTAEGAPPPGHVSSAVPATESPAAPTGSEPGRGSDKAARKTRGPARAPGTRNGPIPRRPFGR